MKVSEVLYAAADEVERRGWARGNCGMSVSGPTCLEGAIAAVLRAPTKVWLKPRISLDPLYGARYYWYSPELREHPAYLAMTAHLGHDDYLWDWNDTHTAAEVIAALRAAAVIEAAKESAEVPVAAGSAVSS